MKPFSRVAVFPMISLALASALPACGGSAAPQSIAAPAVYASPSSGGGGISSAGPSRSAIVTTRSVARERGGVARDEVVMAAAPPPGAASAGGVASSTTVTVGVTVNPMPTVAPSPVEEQQYQQPVGVLTAASVGDVDRFGAFLEYLERHPEESQLLRLDPSRRVRLRVVDGQGHPVNNARITLSGESGTVSARTHADGTWDFFPGINLPGEQGPVTARAEFGSESATARIDLPARGEAQPVVFQLPNAQASLPRTLDLGFAIDVTGSMGDELRYVNAEIAGIVQRVEARAPGVRVRVGATFYRDRTDSVPLQMIPFTDNVPGFAAAMQRIEASGGGDYPEDMNRGLEAAMTRMSWSDGSDAARVLVVIADAPPQMYGDEQFTYRDAMATATQRGIRILPVAASGADRTVEYLFRTMGAVTSTPYTYLTDDSGVGAPHMEADTDRVAVEHFNDLLVRLVITDLSGHGMHEPAPLGPQG